MHPMNIAHRGGAALKPENSLPAFADAIRRGCDGAELDVQLSRDGVAVVHHDFRLMADVARKNGAWLNQPGPRIRDLTLAELRDWDVGRPRPGSRYAATHPLLEAEDDATIPTLEDVMALAKAAPDFRLMVELKCDESEDSADPAALADAALDVAMRAGFLERAVFVGFDWRALARVLARAPGAQCWFTTHRLYGDARAKIDAVAAAGGQGWFPHYGDASPENVAHARASGLKVGAWTVNDPADMRRLMDLDAICTDRPDLLQ
jgi:glycerophosphoryl diester phosphodiesterase